MFRSSITGSKGFHDCHIVLFLKGVFVELYTNALGRDGILVSHEQSVMHCHATEKADLFKLNYTTLTSSQLLRQQEEQAQINREILRQFVYCIEFLAKQGLAFQGHRDNQVNFSDTSVNRGNFVATLQVLDKSNATLQEHLLSC